MAEKKEAPAEEAGGAEAAAPAAAEKKGPPILFIIMFAVNVVFMAGMAFLVWQNNQMQKSKETVQDLVDGLKKSEHEEETTEKTEKEKLMDIVLLPLETFIVNLAGESGARYLKVDMELELTNSDVSGEIEKRKPQLRDIIITLLSSKNYEQLDSQEDKDFLREEIKNTINGFLVTGKVIKVYFSQFVIS